MANICFNIENWKQIIEYPNYSVSDLGNVKNTNTGKILKPGVSHGYLVFCLYKNKKAKSFRTNRLVAINFIENSLNLPDVNHINGIKTDNRVENLEWASERENCIHRYKDKETSSSYTGVSFCKQTKRWRSHIFIDRKLKTFGRFKSEIEAYQARVNFEKQNNIINKYL